MNDATMTENPALAPKVPRRRYLIDPRRQLRATLMTTSVVAVLLVLLNLGLAALRNAEASYLSAVAPQIDPVLQRQDAVFWAIAIAVSVILVAGVVLKTVVETHRTAGAVFALKQRLHRLQQGDLHVSLRLRRRDNLADLEDPFNEMVAGLRRRALADADALDRIASRTAELGGRGSEIATEIADIARAKRRAGS